MPGQLSTMGSDGSSPTYRRPTSLHPKSIVALASPASLLATINERFQEKSGNARCRRTLHACARVGGRSRLPYGLDLAGSELGLAGVAAGASIRRVGSPRLRSNQLGGKGFPPVAGSAAGASGGSRRLPVVRVRRARWSAQEAAMAVGHGQSNRVKNWW